ncbi:MAG: hypothetical protein KIT84_06695 [Labilithrix sp.]|nr:hypothetical protein [Labilithrix sp.]MCW5810681.1 hypothetical protein [Labilithrix sp.]
MKADLSVEVVNQRVHALRELAELERYERRLRELRALYDLARFMERAGTEAGLRRPPRK